MKSSRGSSRGLNHFLVVLVFIFSIPFCEARRSTPLPLPEPTLFRVDSNHADAAAGPLGSLETIAVSARYPRSLQNRTTRDLNVEQEADLVEILVRKIDAFIADTSIDNSGKGLFFGSLWDR